jgi:hypothetical protein
MSPAASDSTRQQAALRSGGASNSEPSQEHRPQAHNRRSRSDGDRLRFLEPHARDDDNSGHGL